MKKHHNKSLQIIANLYVMISKSLRSLWSWSAKSALRMRRSARFSARMRGLTSLHKKRIVSIEDSQFFVWLRKQFRSLRKASVGSSLQEFRFSRFFQQLPKGRKVKVAIMVKSFSRLNGFRVLATASVLCSALFLVACGGGGGASVIAVGTTPVTPVVPVVSVPVLTIVSMSPLPVASSITVSSNVALVGISGMSITTPQSTTLPGNAALSSDKKTLTITMNAPLPYATTLTVTVKAIADGVEGTVTGTILTESAPVACTLPAMANSLGACISPPAVTGYTWNNVIKAWVINIGTLVTGLNELPLECKVIGDACWKSKTADGSIKYFETNLVMTGYSNRKIVFAGIVVSKQSGFAAGNFNLIPIYADTESMAPVLNNLVLNGSITGGFVDFKGSQNGVKFTTPTNGCWEQIWVGTGFNSASTTCPI